MIGNTEQFIDDWLSLISPVVSLPERWTPAVGLRIPRAYLPGVKCPEGTPFIRVIR